MNIERIAFLPVLFMGLAVLPLTPASGQTIEELCRDRTARTEDAWVRVAWKDVGTYDDVRVAYCVLRGNADAKLAFERDAEIVYFGLATVEKKADPRHYTFVIKTSTGRVLKQGPALLQPHGREPLSCRVDVCQFFTEPGERVIGAAVETADAARRR